ncbi:hypothetical protein CFC21_045811 [Triticum aestivum]|uniref:Uncharacterized protein n=3 Tax=Triticinae TaxID=1648030 RepID=A0A453DXX3_AEGTS|nr:uncharacterized protein LOC123073927 [Triticum aestivum]XP_045090533.1 uncharacterized protein LOC123497800 [Aegilops tauschii subsp. strangulata]KAF7034845.1 hypothetical protein CFC21_045811 [Triticum aestivum]
MQMSEEISSAANPGEQNGNSDIRESSQSRCFHSSRRTTRHVETGPKIDQTCPAGSTTIHIAKIRRALRMVEEERFTPFTVRIGPYHEASMVQPSENNPHDKKGKEVMENEQNKSVLVDRLVSVLLEQPGELENLMARAMECYAEKKGKQPCDNELHITEQEKSFFVDRFLSLTFEDRKEEAPQLTLQEHKVQVIEDLKNLKTMKCYAGNPRAEETEEAFAAMMMRDGIYVLCLLVDMVETSPGEGDVRPDEIDLLRDVVFLLENQIPWIVLKELQSLAGYSNEPGLLCTRVRDLLAEGRYITKATPESPAKEPAHLLHLVHTYFAPPKSGEAAIDIVRNKGTGPWKRATLYRRCAYVQFKRREFEAGVESILDVSLQGGTLLIPCLQIDGNTWTILRNLMALEEQMPERPVTAYCVFMSQLARQAEDVEFLEYEGIIINFLGNNEVVVQGFSNLCEGVINDKPSYLYDIWHTLDKRSKSAWNKFMGSFMERNMLDNVQFVAFIGAVILLILQIAQVIIGSLSLINKQK